MRANWLTDWLWARLEPVSEWRKPDFVIGDDYLRRWWIIPRNRLFNIYLHNIRHSDDDRALHDHPWWNVSIVLSGHYIERTIAAGGVHRWRWLVEGDIRVRRAGAAHRLEVSAPCWTLFITGPALRNWGFHCPHGWRPWQEFVDARDTGKVGRGCE